MKSPIKWVGGKSKLLKVLLPLIPEHKGYVEVFGGAGWLLFGKEKSKWEVLNDLDNNLMNLWEVIKNNKDEFISSFEYTLVSRKTFNEYKQIYKNKHYKDSMHQAHILYYLLKAGVGASLPDGGGCGFGIAKDNSRLRLEDIGKDINEAYMRLKKVTIENRDFKDIINSFDSEDSFFYLDPPYRATARASYPVGEFTDTMYKDLRDCCFNIKGKFLLTINDDEYIKELFKGFNIVNHEVYYGISKQNAGRINFKELIITNYKIT
ncbi:MULTISPECIES: DNA adenine methylase [Lysinibacillus]|uniref:DNA adenine methylase n=1 Tax=Lysinibacillus TaxID=400634 RepID=UPI00214ADF4A|nr:MULTISPECIES: DNA adenine methylase [Lysinibacillus]UUV25976.1 DNA adenine methylase [Lysinibacillus sp. FN11]UYB48849.1 DNA adenine methylase [Lysinibacillus capsici]